MIKEKGFTLIELMVVVVIVGVLAAVAVPKMFGMSSKAKASEASQTIAAFERSFSVYYSETSSVGTVSEIGFEEPVSKFIAYNFSLPGIGDAGLASAIKISSLDCGGASSLGWKTEFSTVTNSFTRSFTDNDCVSLTPNWIK